MKECIKVFDVWEIEEYYAYQEYYDSLRIEQKVIEYEKEDRSTFELIMED